MKISASLYANKEKSLESLVQELDRCYIDSFHIDSEDSFSVFEDISKIRRISTTPIDLHIISDKPEVYFEQITQYKIDSTSLQYESIKDKPTLPKTTKWGLSLMSETPINVFEEYQKECDYVLLMTTTPGKSGGSFNKDTFKKIRAFRKKYPGTEIYVDGGVNAETGFLLRMLGVTGIVSGSYLTQHQSIGEALLHLRSSIVQSDQHIEDFMIDRSESPFVHYKQLDVSTIIQSIDDGNLGATMVLHEDYSLFGIATNADLRKGLISKKNDLNSLGSSDIINTQPITISEHSSIKDLLTLIQHNQFLLSFLPVVNELGKVSGSLSLINLIRSES